jgi:hypothetical protein
MTKLTDTQLIALSSAVQHDEGLATRQRAPGDGCGRGDGGRGGIRTHDGLAPMAVFKTAALNHSATLPTRTARAGRAPVSALSQARKLERSAASAHGAAAPAIKAIR